MQPSAYPVKSDESSRNGRTYAGVDPLAGVDVSGRRNASWADLEGIQRRQRRRDALYHRGLSPAAYACGSCAPRNELDAHRCLFSGVVINVLSFF